MSQPALPPLECVCFHWDAAFGQRCGSLSCAQIVFFAPPFKTLNDGRDDWVGLDCALLFLFDKKSFKGGYGN